MNRVKEFFKSALVGGLLVLLPLGIFIFVVQWVFGLVRGAIAPLTDMLMKVPMFAADTVMMELLADFMVIVILVLACFGVGVMVRTRLGMWIYSTVETKALLKIPGYSIIKETVAQFIGNKESPFSSVALVRIFGNETMVSAFVTEKHPDGSYTIFMPTGPNPTSGNIYHVPGHLVTPVDVPVEETMRSIISCGAGSSSLIGKLSQKADAS